MNILVIGTDEISSLVIELVLKSRLLEKIYTASSKPLENIPNINYKNLKELIQKSKILKIDIVLTFNSGLIAAGITEEFRNSGVNLICINKKWLNLETSRLAAKKLMDCYSINNPAVIRIPLNFPVSVKTVCGEETMTANSMRELVEIKEELSGKNVFLEEYSGDEVFDLLSVWDGKNLKTFDEGFEFTEVQKERLDLYKTKLDFMLSDENADFTGFFTSRLVWLRNDWYVFDFIMRPTKESALMNIKTDLLFILNAIIYRKVNEL